MASLLHTLIEHNIEFGLVEIHAGHADNAIPRESTAIISISEEDFTRLKTTLSTFSTEQREIHKLTDPDLQITASQHDSEIDKRTMRSNDTVAFVRAIHAIPNGVISYSKTIPELVETSTSVGLLKTKFEDDQMMIEVVTMQRSSLDTARRQVGNSIRSIFELARAHEVRTEIEYGGWHPNPDSELVKFAKDSFDGQVKIKATHAGLEAGEIGIRYPHLQMISYGPDIVHAHTPNEKVRIVSVEKMYHFTLRLLERISII
jgi:dipeptidase D